MKLVWTRGLEEDAAKEIALEFKSSRVLRKRMIEIALDKFSESEASARKMDNYDSAWPYKQAESNGYRRAMQEIIYLLDENE